MENRNKTPGGSGLPPEFAPGREKEYRMDPGMEFTALPLEFGQHGGSGSPAGKKRRSLRYLMVVPILALLGFLSWKPHTTKASAMPEPEFSQGTVVIDVVRAGVAENTVHYSYTVYTPSPSLDATPEQIEEYKNGTPWPIAVYAKVTDENGKTAAPAVDPDLWEESRGLFDYEIDVTGLEGDMTLTLLALYTEHDEQRQTMVTIPLEELSMEPTLSGHLEVSPGGDADAVFRFIPAPGDTHAYQLRVLRAGQEVHGDEGVMGLSLVDDPGALPINGNSETGYEIHYTGGSAAASIPEGTQLTLYVVLVDDADGKEYVISTNPVDPVERIYDHPVYPLGDGTVVINVFNDTMNFEFPELPVAEDGYRTLLGTATIPEAEFESYGLPSAYTPAGYDFAGWVVHVGNPLDPGYEVDVFSEYGGDPPANAMLPDGSFAFTVYGVLTREDVEKVPPSEDGNRYVNVHAVWINQERSDLRLFLADGFDGTESYDMMVPLASEGYLYLCNYPIPQHEGYEFDGWYDEEGNRVDMLVCYFSFTPEVYDDAGEFAGYDWNQKKNVVLVAHWK